MDIAVPVFVATHGTKRKSIPESKREIMQMRFNAAIHTSSSAATKKENIILFIGTLSLNKGLGVEKKCDKNGIGKMEQQNFCVSKTTTLKTWQFLLKTNPPFVYMR